MYLKCWLIRYKILPNNYSEILAQPNQIASQRLDSTLAWARCGPQIKQVLSRRLTQSKTTTVCHVLHFTQYEATAPKIRPSFHRLVQTPLVPRFSLFLIENFADLVRKYTCKVCFRSYKHSSSLYNHKRFECEKKPKFKCEYTGCTFITKVKGNLTAHHKRHEYRRDFK